MRRFHGRFAPQALTSVSRQLQKRFTTVAEPSHNRFTIVTRPFRIKPHCTTRSKPFHVGYTAVTLSLDGRFKTQSFGISFQIVSRPLHRCLTTVTQPLHDCYLSVSKPFEARYTTDAQPFYDGTCPSTSSRPLPTTRSIRKSKCARFAPTRSRWSA